MSRKCTEELALLMQGLNDEVCHDFGPIRSVVMCKAWQDIRERKYDTFRQAVDDGWASVRSACAAHGGIKPESGFLESIDRNEGVPVPTVVDAFEVRDQDGHPVGVVVEMSDGSADSCAADACTSYPTIAEAMAAIPGARRS